MNTVKKYISLVLSICLFSTLLISGELKQVQAAIIDPVKMYNTQSVNYYRGATTLKIFVQVQNLGYNKAVSAHYKEGSSNEWKDKKGTYLKTLDDGTEIWQIEVSFFGGIEYALKYQVNNSVYWDNNNEKNYTLEDKIGSAALRVDKSYPFSLGIPYSISATVKNLGYNKDIRVRYTEDNWKTWKEQSLFYSNTLSNGTEVWRTDFKLNVNSYNLDEFEYAISYKVNGVTYWENNFGRNFNVYYSSDY